MSSLVEINCIHDTVNNFLGRAHRVIERANVAVFYKPSTNMEENANYLIGVPQFNNKCYWKHFIISSFNANKEIRSVCNTDWQETEEFTIHWKTISLHRRFSVYNNF